MIDGIWVISRQMVKGIIEHEDRHNITKPWALISINEKEGHEAVRPGDFEKLQERHCQKVLSLVFSDITEASFKRLESAYKNSSKKLTLFTEEHAREALALAEELHAQKEKTFLAIHCHAGVSRSGALGIFFCRYFGFNEERFMTANPHIKPNDFVYNTMLKVSGMPDEGKHWWYTPDLEL